jgi:hypothetical protein
MNMTFTLPYNTLTNKLVIKAAEEDDLNLLQDRKRPHCQLIACSTNETLHIYEKNTRIWLCAVNLDPKLV